MPSSGIRHDNSRSTLLRAAEVLAVYTADDVDLSLSELGRRASLPKSTTFRLVSDLVAAGLLDRRVGGYRLGQRLFELGHLVSQNRQLREQALPYLTDLHEATGLTVNLAVGDRLEVVYLEKLVQRSTRVPHTRSGGRLPWYCTALGKAIMAFAPAHERAAALKETELVPLTPRTLTRPEPLRRELAAARMTRLAYDKEESELGVYCVGTPILGREGDVVAAISATGARTHAQARQVGVAVLTIGHGLSRALGSLPPQDD